MRILIKNASLVFEDRVEKGDLLTEGQRIVQVGGNIDAPADQVIDGSGCFVFPGFIDTHTHFDLEVGSTVTADDFISGTKAAVVGGTTTVLDFATQERGMTMMDAFQKWSKKAEGSSCHYGFHMAVSEWNEDRIAEIPRMIENGVTSFKMYMVYDNMRVSDGQIYEAIQRLAKEDCIIGIHCENDDIIKARVRELKAAGKTSSRYHAVSRPNVVEADGVGRLMDAAYLAKGPAWVVHLSTREGLAIARRARERGQEVYLESCPQYLVLEESMYDEPDGAKYVMSPPLRSKVDQEALLKAMGTGEIDWIGTDHCSFTMAQKAAGKDDFSKTPNGGAGVQNRAEIVYTRAVKGGYIDMVAMGQLLSTRAAKLFGMYPRKGVLQAGSDADIVIFDPDAPHTIHMATNLHACDNSPYEGYEAAGMARDVILNGELVVETGKLIAAGRGEYVRRDRCGRYRK
ncbi:MAG: dihydropyrimidinase [Clostridia bacterium]|nr:dihydropyrimidinase [Clostridia bacterium]MBQ7755461.1 dihydropyrimidinase [Clostridia bacterium]MBR0421398.1 dihydropyrimidinase [Clostridia bacterium]